MGGVGQWMQIFGSNFGSSQGSSTVTFNGVAATPIQWASGSIMTHVPAGATTGNVVVTVAGVASNGVTFTVITTPYIASINPSTGGVGTSVGIYGSNFGSSQGSSTVTFNGVAATVSGWSNIQINANVPTGATTGNIVVTVGGVASNAVSFTVYLNPTISSLSSTTGGVGQWTHIQGSNFGSSQGSSTVTFNGTVATALQWTSGYINVDVPSGASTGSVVVTVAGVASNGVAFTVITTPYIASFNPPYGPVGSSVGIYGSNFGAPQGSNTVTFNGVAASVSGWGNNQINANVPTGATTGNLVVTVGGVASNAIAFTVGQAPSFTSSNNATFATGNSGTFTVTASGTPAPSLSESGALPSGVSFTNGVLSGIPAVGTAGTYQIALTASNGISPNATQNFTLTVVTPPSITSSVSPTPNAAGWVNMNATVAFTCTAGTYPIASCPSAQTVTTEGLGQIVSGTAVDTAGFTATAKATINLDKTIPALTVSSPSDGTSETASPVTVSGTLSDSLSGPSGVTCDGVAASLSGGSFSCTVPLNVGNNLVTVRGTDVAGNVAGDNFHLTLSGTLPAPNSLQVTPTGVNMVVGGTQQFTVVDDQGRPRPDATWSVNNTSVASIDTSSSPTLTAEGVGTATLTATVGSLTAQTQVNVQAGASLTNGTTLWSVPSQQGFTTTGVANAVPSQNGPDIYSFENNFSNSVLVGASTADGRQLWQRALNNGSALGTATPDGGLLVLSSGPSGAYIAKFDGATGSQVWSYPWDESVVNTGWAMGQDGTVYFVQTYPSGNPSGYLGLVALDGTTGAPRFVLPVPNSTAQWIHQNGCFDANNPEYNNTGPISTFGRPSIMEDGSLRIEFVSSVVIATELAGGQAGACLSTSQNLQYSYQLLLWDVSAAGQVTSTIVKSDSGTDNCIDQNGFDRCESDLPSVGRVISDGQLGALASWTYTYKPKSMQNPEYHVTDVASGGAMGDFIFAQFKAGVSQMVLGDNGSNLGYATDGQSIAAFNFTNGSGGWTYDRPSNQDRLSILAATSGGQLNIVDTNQNSSGFSYSVVPINSSGAPGASLLLYQGTGSQGEGYSWSGQLLSTEGGSGFAAVQAPLALYAENFWSTPAGDPAEDSAAGATCACDFEGEGGGNPPPPSDCPLCGLPVPTSTQPSCTSVFGNQSTYLILVGDPGLPPNDVKYAFGLAAQTEMNALGAQGHLVIGCRVATVDDAINAITTQGLIDGGVIYFGHSGLLGYADNTGTLVAYSSNIFIGQNPKVAGYRPNIDATTVSSLAVVQTANAGSNSLGGSADFTGNGCDAGKTIDDVLYGGRIAIAQLMANYLKRGVYAYAVGTYFSQYDAEHDSHRNGVGRFAPADIPAYLIPEGAPRHKPNPTGFTPR